MSTILFPTPNLGPEGPAGPAGAAGASAFGRRAGWVLALYNTTGLAKDGGCEVSVLGTAAAVTDTVDSYVRFTSSGAGNSTAGLNIGNNVSIGPILLLSHTGRVRFAVKTPSDITGLRLFIVLADSLSVGSADNSSQHIGVSYCTDVDGTAFWRSTTRAGGGSATRAATTVAFAASTRYVVDIDFSTPASVVIKINGVVAATLTADLPTAALNMIPVAVTISGAKQLFFAATYYTAGPELAL